MLQPLNYTENPIDIPNPDRGPYRGRWQNISPDRVTEENSSYGITPEVDHRVPASAADPLYHGRQVPTVEGDDLAPTEFYNGVSQNDQPYIGGTGVQATPSIAFMGFDLVLFSSNAFLGAKEAFAYQEDGQLVDPQTGEARTGKTRPLTPYALDYIRGLLQTVRDGAGTALVKFSYDGNGFNYVEPFKYPHLKLTEGLILGPEPEGLCNIPGHEDKNWIEYHIWQLKPIFHEFEDIIMCVKTGMVGAWGEQHSSPMSQRPETYKFLLDAYLDAVPAGRSLLTHAGGFLAWYNATYDTQYNFHTLDNLPAPKRGTPEARFGFFNDSYAAGGADMSDNGSLSEGGDMLVESGDSGYNRYRIISWIYRQNNFLQGEGGLNENPFSTPPGAITEATRLRTTALNMRHGNYTTWQKVRYCPENIPAPAVYDPTYEGKTLLEYFRDRLGYRLLLRESMLHITNNALHFNGKIQNVGFGNVINKKQVALVLEHAHTGKTFTAPTELDARDWLTAQDGNTTPANTAAWHSVHSILPLSAFGKLPQGEYIAYVKINDPKETTPNKRCIKFANHDIWNAALGANKIGTISIG